MAEFAALAVGDPPEVWSGLGFVVDDASVAVSGVRLRLGALTPGLSEWALRDGDEEPPPTPAHPNGVREIDHVVLLTPHLDRTIDDLSADGFDLRRIRDAGNGLRQAFFRLGPVILEVVGDTDTDSGEPRLWGITFTVDDLDATAAFLGHRLKPAKNAVQPGRRIATLDRTAGSTVPIAFMSPHAPPTSAFGGRNRPPVDDSSPQNESGASEDEAFALARRFLSYLPSSVHEAPPRGPQDDDRQRRDDWLIGAIPRNRRAAYRIRPVIEAVVDRGSFFEMGRLWGRSAVTGLDRRGIGQGRPLRRPGRHLPPPGRAPGRPARLRHRDSRRAGGHHPGGRPGARRRLPSSTWCARRPVICVAFRPPERRRGPRGGR